ncbi:winged helix DNA-binding protein [Jatrophihabitans sp. GAS493]|uniref:winged helix DNA-binding domain-containing protein n=1 Tax=Jatrophihabitans sp. GAS493 TaxID=1907575 RepID=UPI000BB9153A|nr:winged helix DNA-binding domain-containing protein [Jatrophihabitans sp. GAS493]SOD71411.1 winged helix DNA-binding protein [Jatrophihabitans sp. GAS493]
MSADRIDRRTRNRTLLQRQLLLERSNLSVVEAIGHLIGLQSQAPTPPYYGLWSRLADFAPDDLSQLLVNRQVSRLVMMRSTVHLMTSPDALTLRPLLQPMLDRAFASSPFNRALVTAGVDREELTTAGRHVVEESRCTAAILGAELGRRWPDVEPSALAQAIRTWVPLVQLPPRGLWGRSGQTTYDTAEHWLGVAAAEQPAEPLVTRLGRLVQRYLSAFGPASVADVQKWSGLTRLREVADELPLRRYLDADGRELLDSEDGELIDGQTSAPVRLLAEFDNILLSHAERSHVFDDRHRLQIMSQNGLISSTVLVDGFVAGTWRIEKGKPGQTLRLAIQLFSRVTAAQRRETIAEGARLGAFVDPSAGGVEVTFTAQP